MPSLSRFKSSLSRLSSHLSDNHIFSPDSPRTPGEEGVKPIVLAQNGIFPPIVLDRIAYFLLPEDRSTLLNFRRTSKFHYQHLGSALFRDIVVASYHPHLTALLTALDGTLGDLTSEAKRDGWFYTRKGDLLRSQINLSFVETLLFHFVPDPDFLNANPWYVKESETVVLPQGVELPNLKYIEFTTLATSTISTSLRSNTFNDFFLRPLYQCCSPTTLTLNLPYDSGEAGDKWLLHLFDQVHYKSLQTLILRDVGSQSLPARYGLHVEVWFKTYIPPSWDARPLKPEIQQTRYEGYRLDQILNAIPRSVHPRRVRSVGETRWSFVNAGGFFDGQPRDPEKTRMKMADEVKEWVEREYTKGGWMEKEVEELTARIAFR